MEQKKIIRPRNWFLELLVFLEAILIIVIWRIFSKSWATALFYGALTYLLLAWSLRRGLQRHHRRGMKFLRNQKYTEAAAAFQSSLAFYEKYPWVDKYRFITMFSSNAIPFQQMALNNLGICYLYMGNPEKAIAYFEQLAKLNNYHPNIMKILADIQKRIEEEVQPQADSRPAD